MSRWDGQGFHDSKAGRLVRRRNGEAEVFTAETQGRGEKSQGDFIIKPSVDAMPSRLRWVVDQTLNLPRRKSLQNAGWWTERGSATRSRFASQPDVAERRMEISQLRSGW